MTYKVFGGTLSLTQSINQSTVQGILSVSIVWGLYLFCYENRTKVLQK